MTPSPIYVPKLKYSSNKKKYLSLYQKSLKNSEKFWADLAQKELVWFQKWDRVFEKNGFSCKWFSGGKINITYNCLDRHVLSGGGRKTAFIWVNESGQEKRISYQELLEKVNQTANFFLKLGLKKGDTLTIYMPLTIEQIVVMLACARIGIIHSVVYAGFSYQALETRISDAQSRFIATADFTYRRGKNIDLLSVVREARKNIDFVEKTIVFKREKTTSLTDNEINFEEEIQKESKEFKAPELDAEDPLFILYTSGTTGKPKGILHTQAGYNLFTHVTNKYTFDLKKKDLFWCTADTGWITGHSYVVYGPLSNHLTSIIYEGAPDYPDSETWWKIIEKYKVTIFYTSPTAIRMLMTYGNSLPARHNLDSLRILGSVGEPLNASAWMWYYKYVGKENCAIVDTWWQTETGGHMITTFPGLPQKPGYAGLPYLGIEALIVDENGKEKPRNENGFLVLKNLWPSVLRTCWENEKRFKEYWTKIPGFYFTGDLALKDYEGYIRILGRSDDVIIVAGHNIGSAELESVIASHEAVAEAAVVGVEDKIKGQKIIAFATLVKGVEPSLTLEGKIIEYVGETYGKHARPQEIKFVDKLPKTRSGKIMRRVLKAEEEGKDVGDTSTLES